MKNLLKLVVIFSLLSTPAYAAYDVTLPLFTDVAVFEDDLIINIIDGGGISVDTDVVAQAAINNISTSVNGTFLRTTINIDTTSNIGAIATDNSKGAIEFNGAGASLSLLQIDSGTVSSEVSSILNGTILITDTSDTTTQIIVGQATGGTATISNSATGGTAINMYDNENVDLTINVNATGTISSTGYGLSLAGDNSSTFTLDNEGVISSDTGFDAIFVDGFETGITNSGTINGNIFTYADLVSITQNGGEINGDIDLGTNEASGVNINGGTITGNILMGNAGQTVVFNGGNISGAGIDGAGDVIFAVDTVIGASIGTNSSVNLLKIEDGSTVSLADNGYFISGEKMTIGHGSSFSALLGQFDVNEIDGLAANKGTLNLTLSDGSIGSANSLFGTTNGLAALNISGHLTDPTKSSDITISNSIKALTTTFTGADSIFTLAESENISGDVVIGDGTIFRLNNGSSVSGEINGLEQYQGSLVILHTPVEPAAVSSVVLADDIGAGAKDLSLMTLEYNTTVDAATNNVSINAQNINLHNLARLSIGTGAVTGTIKGFADTGSNNGWGDVEFAADNTLGGDVGTADGNALNSVTIFADADVTSDFEINAQNISLGEGATLTTSTLISGGDNDDSGATLTNSDITLGNNSQLTLDDGASIYATVNGAGSLTINSTLNSTNSNLSIGGVTQLSSIAIGSGVTLDLSANNGAALADAITLDSNATLKKGNGNIAGTIDGVSADNQGTLDFQGSGNLEGVIGGVFTLNLLNVGNDAETVPSNVFASENISATTITVNGSAALLSIAAGKSVNGAVELNDGSTFSVGDGTSVNGTIRGLAQYNGILEVRADSTFSAGGDIGDANLELAEIEIHGALDLNSLAGYTARAQEISMFEGSSLTIGAAAVVSDIKGYGALHAATHGAGQGSVTFASSNASFSGSIGDDSGHAIDELSISENAVVDLGATSVNAAGITLYDDSALTFTSAEFISGGTNETNTAYLNSAITLNGGAHLTLDGVTIINATIDGNEAGDGALILTGNYGQDILGANDDDISIGATHKIATLRLSDNAMLDVSVNEGAVKASEILLGENAVLRVGGGDIVGTVDSDADGFGTFSAVKNTTNLNGLVGFNHGLLSISVGDEDNFAVLVANQNVVAENIYVNDSIEDNYSALTLAESVSVTGDINLGNGAYLNLNSNSRVIGAISGTTSDTAHVNILAAATFVAEGRLGNDDLHLGSVTVHDGALLDLATNNKFLGAQSISLVGSGTLMIGSLGVEGEILGYLAGGDGNAHGTGAGSIIFADNNTINDDIGNNSGHALASITVNEGKAVDSNGKYLYAALFNVKDDAILTISGVLAGGDNLAATSQIGTNVILSDGATLNLNEGADFMGNVYGETSGDGDVNVNIAGNYHNVAFGLANNSLANLNFSGTGESLFEVGNQIVAENVLVSGGETVLELADGGSIDGNIVLQADATLSLGNGSSVVGTITNTSDSTPDGTLIIREDAEVVSNGNIGGGGFKFDEVLLENGASLDLSQNDNSITARIVQIGEDSTLTIGTETLTVNDIIGSGFGVGNVVFADDNTVGGRVGGEAETTLANVTINTGKTVTVTGTHSINAVEIILEDDAVLSTAYSITGGALTGADATLAAEITLGDGAVLRLNNGASMVATVDGAADGQGIFEIINGNLDTNGHIGNTHNLEQVKLGVDSNLNLTANNNILKATNIYLSENSTLTIGTNSVTGDISSLENGLGTVVFDGSTNTLAGDVGGRNDNALENVTINNADSVAAGSHEINASTIVLNNSATLTTSGAISGGADITGVTPIATAITLHENSIITLNTGASIFGTIDGNEAGHGSIEFAANFTTNGNIGAQFQLNSATINDGVTLDLGTNSNSLDAITVYLGDESVLSLGAGGTVNAAISSLNANSGVLYINEDTTFDSGSTLGGDNGLLTIHIDDNLHNGVVVDSNDSIKASNINISGFESTLNLAEDKTITGNVNLNEDSRLNLADGSSVTGTIDSMSNAEGVLGITGAVVSQNHIGNNLKLGNVILSAGATLDLATNDNILKSTTITLGLASTIEVGTASIVASIIGSAADTGRITFTEDNTIAASTFIGNADNSIERVTISANAEVAQNENIYASNVVINGELEVAATKGLNVDGINLSGVLTVNDDSFITGEIQGNNGAGQLIVAAAATFTSQDNIGIGDGLNLASITLNNSATLDLNANDVDARATEVSLNQDAVLEVGIGSITATGNMSMGTDSSATVSSGTLSAVNILMSEGSSITVGAGSLDANIIGNGGAYGDVTFTEDNALTHAIGVSGDLNILQINSLTVANSASLDADEYEIAATSININDGSSLISSGKISGGLNEAATLATNITLGISSTLELDGNNSITANINGNLSGNVEISGDIAGNINIGNTRGIVELKINANSSLDVSANNNSMNVTNIILAETAELTIGTIDLNAEVNGLEENFGTLNIASGKTVTSNGNIGSLQALKNVNIAENATLDLDSNNNSLYAETTTLSENATLKVGADGMQGDVIGEEDGDGSVAFYNDIELRTDLSLGRQDRALSSIDIIDGAEVTINTEFNAQNTNIGTSGENNAALTFNSDEDEAAITTDITLTNLATFNISTSGFLTINGTIDGNTDYKGTLTLSNGGTLTTNGDIGAEYSLAAIYVNLNSSINAYTNSNSIAAADIHMGAGASLIMGSGSITGDVHGSGSDEISFVGDIVHEVNGSLGSGADDNGIGTIRLQGTLSTGANDIRTNNMIFDSAATTLNIGSGDIIIESFTNNHAGSGVINFANNSSMDFAISADDEITELNIGDSATVNANYDIAASEVNIGAGEAGKLILAENRTITGEVTIASNANLTLQNGATVSGNILGTSASGTLEISEDALVIASGDIGNVDNVLGAVVLFNDSTLNLGSNDLIISQLTFYEGSTLTVGAGTISGTLLHGGSINFTADNSMGDSVQIGNEGEGLHAINVNDGAAVTINNLYYASQTNIGQTGDVASSITFNNSADEATLETTVTLKNVASFNIVGSGDLTIDGTIDGDADGNGTLSISGGGSLTLGDDIGATHAISAIRFDGTLNNGEHDIHANSITFNSENAVLNIGSGIVDITTFANNHGGHGVMNFAADNSVDFEIYSENAIAELNIANTTSVDINQNIFATNIAVGEGTLGELTLAATKSITGAITLNAGATLNLESYSSVIGNISSSGDSTTINLANSATVDGNIGSLENAISEINISNNATIDIGDNNLFADNLTLEETATISIGAGEFDAEISGSSQGEGFVVFNADRTLARDVSSEEGKIAGVIVGSGKTLESSDKAIYATSVILENESSFELQNGGSVSNQINGSAAGYGNVRALGTVAFNEIGANHAVHNVTTFEESQVTFNNDIRAAGSVTFNGAAIFTQAQTTIEAASFTTTSGSSLTLSVNLSEPSSSILEIVGAAVISENTTLNLTISGTALSGTRLVLIDASEASTIAQISEAKININDSGLNSLNRQLYSTIVSGNQLLLRLRSFLPEPEVFVDNNVRNTYDTIVELADNATGELAAIKTYLENDDISIAQKEAAIKSVSPQTDNSLLRINFNNASTAANIISTRLESVYNQTSINNGGPSFAYNNNFNMAGKHAFAQNLDTMRDNKSYPLSLSLNEDEVGDEKQALWVQTFSSNVNQNNVNGADGYRSNSGGISIGMDCKKCLDFVIGASTTYAQSDISSKAQDKFLNIDSYQFNVYTGHKMQDFFVNSSVGFALNRNNSTRLIPVAATTARANYSSETYSARAEIGSSYKFDEVIFTPSLMITAARNSASSYSEGGAGTLNLRVKNNSSNFLEGRVNAEFSRLYLTTNEKKIRPQFSISYGYDFVGDQQRSSSNFVGQVSSFSSEGAKIAQGSLRLATGFMLYTKENVTLGLNYNYEYRDGYNSNTVWGRLRYGF